MVVILELANLGGPWERGFVHGVISVCCSQGPSSDRNRNFTPTPNISPQQVVYLVTLTPTPNISPQQGVYLLDTGFHIYLWVGAEACIS